MHLQDVIWSITLAGIGLIALAFILVIAQSGKRADDEAGARAARTARRMQAWLFGALLVVFAAGSYATLRPFPIFPQHRAIDVPQVVDVVARMWSWQIEPATIRTGSAVEFRVTSGDVNHGFAIYAPDGRIVAQTQAMPGYTNKLVYDFTAPGTYTIQCLEFCGIGHAPMTGQIEVVAQGGE